ncbi:protein argonaute 18-like [Iris pallida]|uniref:Protein argonaute 18-like n=1 Tax=Iris pallida TaxID=29817 RepID=A0AAX6I427_IRIPA|nr:protein argonaute 18-like [Iris pallida]
MEMMARRFESSSLEKEVMQETSAAGRDMVCRVLLFRHKGMVLLVESGVSDSWYLYIDVRNMCGGHRHNDTVLVVVLAVVIGVVMWMMMVWWRTSVAVE